MHALAEKPIVDSVLQEAFDRLVAVFADDPVLRAELEELFAPLLSGAMSYEEHRRYLREHYGA